MTSHKPLSLFVCLCVFLLGCGMLGEALVSTQKRATQGRKISTVVLDAKCLAVAKACPVGEATDCKPLMACWKERAGIYDKFRKIQLGAIWGLALLKGDKKILAEGYLKKIQAMLLSLDTALNAAGILPGGVK